MSPQSFGLSIAWALAYVFYVLSVIISGDNAMWTAITLCIISLALTLLALFLRPSRLLLPTNLGMKPSPMRMMCGYLSACLVVWCCAFAYDFTIIAATRSNLSGNTNVLIRLVATVVIVSAVATGLLLKQRRRTRLTDDSTASRVWPPRPHHGSLWVFSSGLICGWLAADLIWAVVYTYIVGLRSLDIFVMVAFCGFAFTVTFSLALYALETRTDQPLRRASAYAMLVSTAMLFRFLLRVIYFNIVKFSSSFDARILYYVVVAAGLTLVALVVIALVHWPITPPTPRVRAAPVPIVPPPAASDAPPPTFMAPVSGPPPDSPRVSIPPV